jgi:hypoxanthine-DNA glycosylase
MAIDMTRPGKTPLICTGMPPLVGERVRILILGSMPGADSLAAQRYYAHPRNQFWPIVSQLFGLEGGAPYPDRVAGLIARGVAVWDVLKHCERSGSLDSAILRSSEIANDFDPLLAAHPELRVIAFNGAKAQQAFLRHVLPRHRERLAEVALQPMPSTSPAHAGRSLEQKRLVWSQILV